jgi:hypothetical protein
MANRKISDLTALTTPATGDLLPIVDISEAAAADKNKKITFGELFASILAGTAAAPSVAFEGDSNTGIYSPGADQIGAATGGTSRIVVDASGRVLVDVAANANGGILQLSSGITFPATAVAASDANTLDDYEEGTWTPTQGGGLTVVGAYSSQGSYTKVGNKVVVFASLFAATSIASASADILCGGLPFTPTPPAGANGFIVGSLSNQAGNISNTCLCVNTTNVYGAVAIAATTGIHVTLTYRV